MTLLLRTEPITQLGKPLVQSPLNGHRAEPEVLTRAAVTPALEHDPFHHVLEARLQIPQKLKR